jgi:predicted aconitase
MAEDLAIHPEWVDYTEAYGAHMSTEDEEISDAADRLFDSIDHLNEVIEGCPFAHLFAN